MSRVSGLRSGHMLRHLRARNKLLHRRTVLHFHGPQPDREFVSAMAVSEDDTVAWQKAYKRSKGVGIFVHRIISMT